jgi:adenylate cyclase
VAGTASSMATTPRQSAWSERRAVKLLVGARGRPLGALFLAVLLALTLLPESGPADGLKLALFDAYQTLFPREQQSAPAIVVAIDEQSLAEHGQWPWPRTLLARLIDNIAEGKPAAIGIDALFPEPDRLSPDRLAPIFEHAAPELARQLAGLPGNDSVFAGSIAAAPVVLGIAGLEEVPTGSVAGRTAPFLVRGANPSAHLRSFAAGLRSLPELDNAAAGHALLSVDPRGGIVRRVPLVATIGGTLTPALSVEMLRVASATGGYVLHSDRRGVRAVAIGDLSIPTGPDGTVWVHFSPSSANRLVSAADVLAQRIDPLIFDRRLVLVGATGLGLLDHQATPLGVRMPGIEIHAQLLENIFDGRLLGRPASAAHAERLLLLVCGLILIAVAPAVRPRTGAMLFVALLATCFALGFGLYLGRAVLFDGAWPAVGTTLVYGALLAGTLAETDRQRRALALALAEERDAAARAAGELEAARRIQLGMLPPTSGDFLRDRRFELEAMLETAKTVGGDLYDYFKLDDDRLFFAVGDVSGKGLPASIFMAVSKSLYKSAALRSESDIGTVMRAAHAEIARDNPEALFVTLFAGLLDLRNGQLTYCNAGHEEPLLAAPGRTGVARLEGGDGPPLCVLEKFDYRAASYQMQCGEVLCAVTDGVTEAMDVNEELYGRARLAQLLASQAAKSSPRQLVSLIEEDVQRHSAGAERSDDITILVLKWNGEAR